MADVIVEKESNNGSGAGVIVAIVAVVLLVIAALYVLPGLINNSPATPAAPTVTAPTQ